MSGEFAGYALDEAIDAENDRWLYRQAKTTAERQEDLRARRLLLGLTEVRGIYANPDDHAAIKKYAAKLQKARLSGNHKPLAILPESV